MSAAPGPGGERGKAPRAEPCAPGGERAVGSAPNEPSRELTAALRERLRGRVAVMGVGNPLRGDDGVGSIVARKLRRAFAWVPAAEAAPDVEVATVAIVDAEEIPESYLDVVVAARPAVVVLIDAADMGCAPGSVTLVEGPHLGDHTTYTHRTPLAPVARYLEQRTGAAVLLAAIQPGPQGWGEALSGEVQDTANRLANILWDALCPKVAESLDAPWAPEAQPC